MVSDESTTYDEAPHDAFFFAYCYFCLHSIILFAIGHPQFRAVISNSRPVPFVSSLVFETQSNFGAAGSVLPSGSEKGVGRYQFPAQNI
jgi:hypothetical protein